MAPDGGVGDVATEETGDGRRGAEENVLAAIVDTGEAGTAGMARDIRLDSDFVAWFEMLDGWMNGDNLDITG